MDEVNETTELADQQIESLRDNVDKIDDSILQLLAERRRLSSEIAGEKQRTHRPFRDESRENSLLTKRIEAARQHDLDPGFVVRIWEQIISDSVSLQHERLQGLINGGASTAIVALQGIEGSYSQLAAEQFFRDKPVDISLLACTKFSDTVDAVEHGRADVAILPVENTTSGGIAEVYDLLLHSRLAVIGEVKYRVRHCLLGTADSSLDTIKSVYGHPQAVTQCSEFLGDLQDVEVIFFGDTAMSGRRIKAMGDPAVAAIASEEAARRFGLQVLKRDIGNRKENFTRFLVVARDPISVDERIPSKTSLVLAVGNAPGALMEVLAEFSTEGIPLVKLESRPTVDNPWEEMFYLDFDGNVADERVQRALDGVKRKAKFVRVLGCYPSQDLRPQRRNLDVAPDASRIQVKSRSKEPEAALKPSGYKIASRVHKGDNTVIEVGDVKLGGDDLVVIAGPCAVESFDQVMTAAAAVKAAGATILRGGCFKPRTSPYSFQGLGYEGLEMLVEAGRAHGMPIVTEVPAPEEVEKMSQTADILQIGARNMQNFTLLSEVGRSARPVMLKRGMSASLDELLQAAEYILDAGNQQVFLCERGIRTFETSTRNTLDVAAVPVLQSRTHLPVIVDPSHAAGDRKLVTPLALAGQAAGAHGIMVEVHPNPAEALSDGPQALDLDDFANLMELMVGSR
ncbi:MAG: 3-deoxy-7-phosphoheptulonate synthase [Actinobacteria bacterium]|nr:MAG: 3-deoxy-7-phosphoheptulonate synthase [Actinomycetota bacterium]